MVNENASLIKYEPPKCDECGRKILVLSDLCAKCADGIELNGKEQANRPGTNPLPTWPKPPAPPNPPPAPTHLLGLLKGAFDWIESAPHGDNCFVSDHYEGDPGNRCNCGKDSLLSAYEEFGQPEAPAVAQKPVAVVPSHCTGAVFVFEGGVLNVNKDGSGEIQVQERDFQYLDSRCAWVAKFETSEVLALRDFLNAQPAPAVAVNEPFYSGFISGEQDWKVLQTAVDTWGEYEQVMMAIGECGEFLTLMGRKVQGRLIESDMHDEIADVLIMMHQMANIYGIDHVRARVRHKLRKLAAKLDKATAQAEASKGGV